MAGWLATALHGPFWPASHVVRRTFRLTCLTRPIYDQQKTVFLAARGLFIFRCFLSHLEGGEEESDSIGGGGEKLASLHPTAPLSSAAVQPCA